MGEYILEMCWECEGTGKVRANHTGNGNYVFDKVECDECLGTGKLDVSVYDDHECED